MAASPAAGNLLYGLLALQTNFITREQLLAATAAWLSNPKVPLGQHLSLAGAIVDEDKRLLVQLMSRHVKLHDNDPKKSLTALGAAPELFDALGRLNSPLLGALLAEVRPPTPPQPEPEPEPDPPFSSVDTLPPGSNFDPFATVPPGSPSPYAAVPPGDDPYATVPPGDDPYATVPPPPKLPYAPPQKKSPIKRGPLAEDSYVEPPPRAKDPYVTVPPSRAAVAEPYVPPTRPPEEPPVPTTRPPTVPPARQAAAPAPLVPPPSPPPPPPQAPVVIEAEPVTSPPPARLPPTQPPPAPPPPRFRRLRPHARGSRGEVSVGRDEEFDREVALKQLQERYNNHPESRLRFTRESEVVAKLEHPGIVPIYGKGNTNDGRPFYAMRLVTGETLHEAIIRFHDDRRSGAAQRWLTLRDLVTRFVTVCDAVAYAHERGVWHRDLSPTNVMLGDHGETLVVEWGLARVAGRPDPYESVAAAQLQLEEDEEPPPGSVLGTPAFSSPEQAGGRLDLMGPHSDVFSLGAMLYQILTRRPPYEGEGLAAVLRQARRGQVVAAGRRKGGVPPGLAAVCARAMRAEPEDRYESARAMADDVRRWLADEPVSAYREPLSATMGRWARHHRRLTMAALLLPMLGLLGLVVYLAVIKG